MVYSQGTARHARWGVTLIELLVAMSVSGLVLIAVLGIFNFSTRQLGTQTGRAQTQMIGDQAMNAMCKEIGQDVSYGTDFYGDMYFQPPASFDAHGNPVGALVNGALNYSPSATGYKYYPSDDTGATQGSNTGGSLSGITSLWRATTNKLNGNPKWQADAAWSQMNTGGGSVPQYPEVSSLTFTTSGMPANTVQVTLVMSDKVGSQTSTYTVTRVVYLSNHN